MAIAAQVSLMAMPAGAEVTLYRGAEGPYQVAEADLIWRDSARDRVIPAHVYAPALAVRGEFPLIVLSHGFGETRTSYGTLSRDWAAHGYIVIAVNHLGSDAQALAGMRGRLRDRLAPADFALRPGDLNFAIDMATAPDSGTALLTGRVDRQHIASAGHSLGSTTALAVAGLKTVDAAGSRIGYRDERVTAALAMSGQIGTALGGGRAGSIGGQTIDVHSWDTMAIPVMIVHGTNDQGFGDLRRNPSATRVIFDKMPAGEKYMVVVTKMEHHAFTDTKPWYPVQGERDPRHYEWLGQVTLAFFDAYLKGNDVARAWLAAKAIQGLSGGAVDIEIK